MEADGRYSRRVAGQGWLSTLFGVLVLVAGGFALGLVVGVISEEPELVVGHVAGRTTEIEWSAVGKGIDPGDEALGTGGTSADWPLAEAETGRESGSPSADPPERELPPVAAPADPRAGSVAPDGNTRFAAAGPAIVSAATEGSSGAVRLPIAADEDPSGSFAIQVGAFQESQAAQSVAGRLRASGYPVQVVPPEADDRWRVRVGPIKSRLEADETAQRLKVEQNLPTWVLRESLP